MGNRLIPEMERKVWIYAAPSCYEVVLARADGSFGSICPVFVRGNKLKIDLLFVHDVLFQELTDFIIRAL